MTNRIYLSIHVFQKCATSQTYSTIQYQCKSYSEMVNMQYHIAVAVTVAFAVTADQELDTHSDSELSENFFNQ
jgi:hypothetical protein